MITKLLKYRGFTLVELMVTLVIALLVFAGIGVAMVDSVKSFPAMYNRTEGVVVNDAYEAKAAFDRICRKATYTQADIDAGGTYLEVYYYDSPSSPKPDRYARFYRSGNSLMVDYGTCDISIKPPSKNFIGSQTLATTVNYARFYVNGADVVMVVGLASGNQTMTVTSSALRHNAEPL